MPEDKKENYFEGSTPVDGDVSPVTRRKIDKVDALRWDEMSTAELHDQRAALQDRYVNAQMLGHPQLIQQLEMGIRQIDEILNERPGGDTQIHMF